MWIDIILMVAAVATVSICIMRSFKPKKMEVKIGRSVQDNRE